MTLKEKIMNLQTYKMFVGEDTVYVEREDILKLLYKEPTTKNDLGIDCISREQALRELKESAEHHANDSREEALLRRDRDIIKALPPVTPIRPKGHWQVKDTYPQECECWDCSECQETVFEKSNFCPNCGANMEEVEE